MVCIPSRTHKIGIHIVGYNNNGEATNTQALYIVSCTTSDCDLGRFTYDKCGNRRTMCDSRGTTVYVYDALNRLVTVVEPDGKWIAYEYDLNSNRTKMTVHLDLSTEHVTQYTYYDDGLLHEVTDQLSGVTSYTYKDNGLVDTITYPNSTKAIHTYNSRNWLTTISNRKSNDDIIAEFTYSFDATYWGKNGTRTRVVEEIHTPSGSTPTVISAQVDYEYDDLYRLVHEHRIAYNGGNAGVTYEYNYAYDAAGNRKSWQVVGGSTTNYTYDAANKMTAPGTFVYDDKGNITTDGVTGATYTWDFLNRMTEWQKTGQTTVDFVYNANGIRVRKTPSGGTATNFLLDRKEIAEEITGSTATAYIGCGLTSRITGTTRTVCHADGMGSTRAMSDGSQGVAEAGIYDAYGNLKAEYPTSSAPDLGYAGQHRYYSDSTGLDYLKARYYDPAVGRFPTRDPVGYEDGLNVYTYAKDVPTMGIDPSGLSMGCVGLGFSGGGAFVVGGTCGYVEMRCWDPCERRWRMANYEYCCACLGFFIGGGPDIIGCITDDVTNLPGGNVFVTPVVNIGWGDGFRCASGGFTRGAGYCKCKGRLRDWN